MMKLVSWCHHHDGAKLMNNTLIHFYLSICGGFYSSHGESSAKAIYLLQQSKSSQNGKFNFKASSDCLRR
uniref:Uncharacterized protein n=1 Tax=Rhizophora mucronata TaxID=61149 RepID=A0A2P2N4J8_RHIMU